ncbi:MAG: spore coat protein [Verrucomicrobiota bacterium]|jgi:hypothetical protein
MMTRRGIHGTARRPSRCLALAALFLLCTLPGRAATPAGQELFSDGKIRTFKIEVSETELAALKKSERAYVPATVTVDGRVFRDVGIHLKGMGSFQPLDQKPSFVVKFDKYTPEQSFMGLNKIMLNNSVQDSTYLAELMATQMFRDAGVPAARVTHAFVEVNHRKLDLYVLIEAMNKEFLKQHFKSAKGNLYEAYLQDIDKQLDMDGGVDTSQNDRKRLLEFCTIASPLDRWSRLPEVLDVDKYLSHCAIEMFVAHTDGYALNRNNYRIYHDPLTGRFTMIAHGLDWGFLNTGAPINPPYNSIITRAVLGTPDGRRAFWAREQSLFTNLFKIELFSNRVSSAVAKLCNAARDTNEAKRFEGYGREMMNRIVARHQIVSNHLAAPEPQTVQFDRGGIARLSGWRTEKKAGTNVTLDITTTNGKVEHVIRSGAVGTIASWRTKVILPASKYRFSGEVSAVRLVADSGDTNASVCLRVSGAKRPNKLNGDLAAVSMDHEFEVTVEGDERELVCEVRAHQGEVRFDVQSLRLVRLKSGQ